MEKDTLDRTLEEVQFPVYRNRQELDEFAEDLIMDLWHKGYELKEIRTAVEKKMYRLNHMYAEQNTKDILQGKYTSLKDAEQRMPLYSLNLPDDTHLLVNVPDEYRNWMIVLSRLSKKGSIRIK